MKAFRTKTGGKRHLTVDGKYSICGQRRKWSERHDVERTGAEDDVCKQCANGLEKTTSTSQMLRQTTRDEHGRYSLMSMCEICGKHLVKYYSEEHECEVCENCSQV